MAEHYAIGYVPPLGFNSNLRLGLKEQTTVGAKVIGAGGRDIFKKRFGAGYFGDLKGISENTLIILLEYQQTQKILFFLESRMKDIKFDAKIKQISDLEGRVVSAVLQYGRPVGINI